MKYASTASFDRDYAHLPRVHREMFRATLQEHILPAIAEGSFTGTPPWPKRLRIHQVAGGIYSLTWSFSGPDGRGTFHLERTDPGDTILVWRRIGTHVIYQRP